MDSERLGITVPEYVSTQIDTLQRVLQECRPYNPSTCTENEEFYVESIKAAESIVRFLKAVAPPKFQFTSAEELTEICENTHASCNDSCPVFKKNHGIPWNSDQSDCLYFKDGEAMLNFLKKD